MDNFRLLNFIILSITFLIVIVFIITSMFEREKHAVRRGLLFSAVISVCLICVPILPIWFNEIILLMIILPGLSISLLSLAPIGRLNEAVEIPDQRVDERDIPFARIRLVPGSPEFESYYQLRPENLPIDERIRKLPGLLSPSSKYANPFGFAAADASFDFIETFREAVDWPADREDEIGYSDKLTNRIKMITHHYGARTVGITPVKPYHIYSHIGRGSGKFGDPVKLNHPLAVVFTVEMDHTMIRCAPQATVVMESAKQYVEAARIAMQLAILLSKLGYSSRAHIDGNYRVIAPLIARDAGLGEIGRMGLLMTPELGPRVRLGVVTTDAPLKSDSYQPDNSLIDFCNICKKCAENCPSKSIPFEDRKEINGALRWQIDWMGCFRYWNVIGTDCCRCMAVCPYSHPENFIHNAVRSAIKRSGFLRRVALKLDDQIYGRSPEQNELPEWLMK